jgi:Transposase IS4
MSTRSSKIMRTKEVVQLTKDSTSNEDTNYEDELVPTVSEKGSRTNYQPNWCKKDLKESEGMKKFPWKLPPPALDTHLSPVTLFEFIFTPQLMELICKESTEYAIQKGIQNSEFDIPTLKLVLSILLLSGYVQLPRRSMYWEAECDVRISLVSRSMSRNRFSSIINAKNCLVYKMQLMV